MKQSEEQPETLALRDERSPEGHSPKTGALIAYESGALSSRGRKRLEKHLAGCSACRRELAAMQLYDEAVDVIRDARLPKVDWSKMELALEREARTQVRAQADATRRGWMVPAIGIGLLAAAAALMMVWPSAQPSAPIAARAPAEVREPRETAPRQAVAAPAMSARITLVAGAGHVTERGPAAVAAEGLALAEGVSLTTDEGGSIHALLASADGAPQVGLALAGSSALRIAGLDATEATLGLESGSVSTRVHSARTIVLAGEYRIAAEVAWFVVDVGPGGAVSVDVREGEVRVTGPSIDRVLTGPADFSSAGSEARLEGDEPVGMGEGYGQLPRLHVARPGIVRWQIGDAAVTGAGELTMRVGTGDLSVSGWDARGHEFHTTASVGADGLDLAPGDLRPSAPRVRVGTLPTTVIQGVVNSHHASLQRCYERALRQDTQLTVHVDMQITIDMTGEVSGVRLSGDELPPVMSTCLTRDVEGWTFPAPDGGPMTFVLPNTFAPR